jgi:alkaline phosphatase D
MPDTPGIKLREGGNALNPDAWDGYTAERDRVFGHLRSNEIGNTVVLTGDVHSSWALDLVEDPFDPRRYDPLTGVGALGVEVVTPAVSSPSLAETFDPAGAAAAPAIEAAFRAANPHVRFVDVMEHGYVVLDVTAARVRADWFFVDTVAEPSDGERLGASWEVLDGEQHLRSASGPAPAGAGGPVLP